jgi:hypothetical protein
METALLMQLRKKKLSEQENNYNTATNYCGISMIHSAEVNHNKTQNL